jgi:hypothetical protein
MSNDPTELVVAGNGSLYVAPFGTALPDPDDDASLDAALDAAFTEVGYVTEDGLTLGWTPTVEEFRAWQSRHPVRREMTEQEWMFTFVMEQWNTDNLLLAFGGGEVQDLGGGVHRLTFLEDDAQLDELSLVCDWNDGTKRYRLVVTKGTVTDGVEVQLQRAELAVLPVSFKLLDPGDDLDIYMFTDDPAYTAAS